MIYHHSTDPSKTIPNGLALNITLLSTSPTVRPFKCEALLDTGASYCAIDAEVADHLQLPVAGFTTYTSASQKDIPTRIRVTGIEISGQRVLTRAIEAQSGVLKEPFIIGRSILFYWHIVLDMKQGKYTICW